MTGGAIPAIVTLASMSTPADTMLTSIIAVAVIAIAYAVCRTVLKLWIFLNEPMTAEEVSQYLAGQFNSMAAGGQVTSAGIEPSKVDPERAKKS